MKHKIEFRGEDIIFTQVDVAKESVWDYVEKILTDDGDVLGYKVKEHIGYWSLRYKKWIICEAKDISDGATYAKDLNSFGWIFHDELCNECIFEDGSPCTNWQASQVLTDIMAIEGFWFRKYSWLWSTFLLGGDEIKETNGWW